MIKNLQVLRAFAAVSVIFVHLGVLLGRMHIPAFGATGVDLFFVISGFVMVYTTETKPPAPTTFMLNRIIRVVPIYWLATLSVFAVALIKPSLLGSTVANVADLARSLLFIPYKKASGLVEPVLFVGWSLNYEMFFYVIFTLGLCFRRYILGISFTLCILAALVVVNMIAPPTGVIAGFYFNPVVSEFAVGILIALAVRRAPTSAPLWAKLVCCVGLFAAPVLLLESIIWPTFPGVWVSALLSAALVSGAVLLDRWGWTITWRPILLVGDASYLLYLTHPYVTQTFQKVPIPLPAAVLAPLCVACAIGVAVVAHLVLEKPLTVRLKDFLKPQRSRVAAPRAA